MIENLNQLKRALRPGIRLQIVDHRRTECINQLREVTWITSNGFCTKVLNQPADKIDAGNNGRGAMLWWGPASTWTFENGVCSSFTYGGNRKETLRAIIAEGEKLGLAGYPVHIKIDSGMHRLGFEETDMEQVVEILNDQTVVIARSVFSHFAGSDEKRFDDYSHRQIETFSRCADYLQQHSKHKILRHILNTAGILRFPEYQMDMVRLGIGLYGVSPIDTPCGLETVSTLKTTILQIKTLSAGETIGYGRKGVLSRDSRIAAIPIGYADGLDRHLGNGKGGVVVNRKRAAIVGNICMDVCMIDVTDIDCKPGDRVEIFGEQLPVTEIAEKLDTIPYEILTSVSTRVKRIYYRE